MHCSGALSSEVFDSHSNRISVHPVQTFPDYLESLEGIYVGLEGGQISLDLIAGPLSSCGMNSFEIKGDKLHYHAANVFMCNYLTVLLNIGQQLYASAGISREESLKIAEPLIRSTLENNLGKGPENSLTGPIARGDVDLINKQLDSLPEGLKKLYSELGRSALSLSRVNEEKLNQLRSLFDSDL